MRRTPAARPCSLVILKRPISPSERAWVPPQSSTESLVIVSTRTTSPYFSPNIAMAPRLRASSMGSTSVSTGASLEDLRVDQLFDPRAISSTRDGLAVREVEAQAVGRDERALLRRLLAQHGAKRPVQQVRRRVVAARRGAQGVVDLEVNGIAHRDAALGDLADVSEDARDGLLRVVDLEAHGLGAAALDDALVADLPARLAVQRRDVGDDDRLLALHRADGQLAVLDDGDDVRLALLALVAHERSRPRPRSSSRTASSTSRHTWSMACSSPSFEPSLRARCSSSAFSYAGLVDRQPALLRDDLREVEREAVGVVELEGGLARDDGVAPAPAIAGDLVLEDLEASLDGLAEPDLLLPRDARDDLLARRRAPGTARPSGATTSSATSCRNGSRMPSRWP